MGFSSDIMNDFVSKEIKSVYSSYDGWKMTQRNLGTGYDTLVMLERRNGGHRDYVKILVTFAKEVQSEMLDELKKTEPASDGTVTRHGFAVMVPANADTSSVPSGYLIYTMTTFAFDGNDLRWIKKPVQKVSEPKVAC
jgi:hypothetical protein